jgi:hypothetical protein
MRTAAARTFWIAGKINPINTARIASTTSSSTRVNAWRPCRMSLSLISLYCELLPKVIESPNHGKVGSTRIHPDDPVVVVAKKFSAMDARFPVLL